MESPILERRSPQWTPTDLTHGAVTALAGDGPQALSLLLDEQGASSVYHTESAGASWELLGAGLPAEAHVTTVATSLKGFYAGTLRRGVFFAQREGHEWRPAGAEFPEHEAVLSLAVQGAVVLAGTTGAGVWCSVEGGAWAPVNQGLPLGGKNLAVPALAIADRRAFASHPFGLHGSTDGGECWHALNTGLPISPLLLTTLLVTPDQTLLAAGPSRLYRSDDDGATWTTLHAFDSRRRSVRSLAAQDRFVFASVQERAGSRIYESADGGWTWRPAGAGLPPGRPGGSPLAASGRYLLAGVGTRGVWRRDLEAGGGAGNEAPVPVGVPAFTLLQNTPNPFSEVTTIRYEIRRPARATLEVLDVRGQTVWSVAAAPREVGTHHVAFDAEELPDGFYTCRLTVGAASQTRQMLLLR